MVGNRPVAQTSGAEGRRLLHTSGQVEHRVNTGVRI